MYEWMQTWETVEEGHFTYKRCLTVWVDLACRLAPAMQYAPLLDGWYPLLQPRTMHRPAAQPTLDALEIAVQSTPSPMERQPPHDSIAAEVSMHSKPPVEWAKSSTLLEDAMKVAKLADPRIGHALSPVGHSEALGGAAAAFLRSLACADAPGTQRLLSMLGTYPVEHLITQLRLTQLEDKTPVSVGRAH